MVPGGVNICCSPQEMTSAGTKDQPLCQSSGVTSLITTPTAHAVKQSVVQLQIQFLNSGGNPQVSKDMK